MGVLPTYMSVHPVANRGREGQEKVSNPHGIGVINDILSCPLGAGIEPGTRALSCWKSSQGSELFSDLSSLHHVLYFYLFIFPGSFKLSEFYYTTLNFCHSY